MGNGRAAGSGHAARAGTTAEPGDRRGAAAALRAIVERLVLPGHVAGYLRGYADALDLDAAHRGRTASRAGTDPLAGYLREPPVSSGLTVDEQRRTILAASGRYGITVSDWYEDANGTAKNLRRGGLAAARSAIDVGEAHGIVVAEAARLGRNSLDVVDLIARARDEGWRVVALDCRFDSATATGAIVAGALAAARRSEWRKVASAKPQKQARPAGHGRPGGEVAVSRSVVERIARMRTDGESHRAIATVLNRDGVVSPEGGEWRAMAHPSGAARGSARGGDPPPHGEGWWAHGGFDGVNAALLCRSMFVGGD